MNALPRSALAPLALIVGGLLAGNAPLAQQPSTKARPRTATQRNVALELQERLDAGSAELAFEEHGYLRSLLRELDVPESSQMLVYSKTSLQRDWISPETPRALYFNDDIMVGYCHEGRILELAAADGGTGTAFFTLEQTPVEKPALERQGLTCVGCHATSATLGVTGLLVRSLSVDDEGRLLLDQATHRIDHSSPLAERWGGWYVTGSSGRQQHLGNRIGPPPGKSSEQGTEAKVLELAEHVPAGRYLTPHSDIVALMVFEHQSGMLNRMAKAGSGGRRGRRAQGESANDGVKAVGDELVKHLLFTDEAPLTDRIEGTSSFAHDFAARGPRDSQGRSLRDFDLQTRLFRYPCSYLIYSRSFDALPGEVKDYVYRRLWDTLTGPQADQEAPHLSADDRQAIVEILRETKDGLPEYWRSPASG